jgi:hypothetical protein
LRVQIRFPGCGRVRVVAVRVVAVRVVAVRVVAVRGRGRGHSGRVLLSSPPLAYSKIQ